MDGAQYAKRDTILGLCMVNLVVHARHLVCTLRKAHICRCGCGGWDSLCPICSCLHWCCQALSLGRYPETRNGNTPFEHGDWLRADLARKPIHVPGVTSLYLKACMYACGRARGVHTTASNAHPRALRRCSKQGCVVLDGCDATPTPWPLQCVHARLLGGVCAARALEDPLEAPPHADPRYALIRQE